jgi:ABC-2 type transport system permease protein
MDPLIGVVASKEARELLTNRRYLLSGAFFAVYFSLMNGLAAGDDLDGALFILAPTTGAMIGYIFSSSVFFKEKQNALVETLLCTPISLRTLWLGKVIGVSGVAYAFSLASIASLIGSASYGTGELLLPSLPLVAHALLTVPAFTLAAVGLIGYVQLLLGLKENRVISLMLFFVLFFLLAMSNQLLAPLGGVGWTAVLAILGVSGILLIAIDRLSRSLSKERVVVTIPD